MDSVTVSNLRPAGVALLESLLALALFGVAIVALVGILKEMSLITVESTARQHALSQTQSLLEEQLRSPQIEEGTSEVGPDERGIRYRVVVAQETSLVTRQGMILPGMYWIQVTASWDEGGRTERVEAETLRNALLYR